MPKNSRKITEPLFETTERTIPKWKLSFISSELYHSKELEAEFKGLRQRIYKVIDSVGLHPLTKVQVSRIEEKDRALIAGIWGKIVSREKERKRLIKKSRNKKR